MEMRLKGEKCVHLISQAIFSSKKDKQKDNSFVLLATFLCVIVNEMVLNCMKPFEDGILGHFKRPKIHSFFN